MAELVLNQKKNTTRVLLEKKLTTVGSAPNLDAFWDLGECDEALAYSIIYESDRHSLLPSEKNVFLNGIRVRGKTFLSHCDRIEWNKNVAVFLADGTSAPRESRLSSPSSPSSPSSNDRYDPLELLHLLSETLASGDASRANRAFSQLLEWLVWASNAEDGALLVETSKESEGWRLIDFQQSPDLTQPRAGKRKELFSQSILNEALARREPVYIENMIGHAYAQAESVMAAKLFSVACFPLLIAGQVLGAVFLSTRSPGRMIRKERLGDLAAVSAQAAFLLKLHPQDKKLHLPTAETLAGVSTLGIVHSEQSPLIPTLETLKKLAPAALSVLICGETGTGKELFAKALHAASSRAQAPFIAVNCAAIPPTLLESILFGHEKGAFTGAVRAQDGKFVQANGGTIFLDEIGDLSLEVQAKLLRVLQEKVVEPVGSLKNIALDTRTLCATHKNLEAMVRQGLFRQDLYFRLAGATLDIPPLRERREDIEVLAGFFLKKNAPTARFTPEALEALLNYPWPGNVRELEHVIERAAALRERSEISAKDLDLASTFELPSDDLDFFWEDFESLSVAQMKFTKKLVEHWLSKLGGNRAKTAERLGVSERTLYRILSEPTL